MLRLCPCCLLISETWGFELNVQLVPGRGTQAILGRSSADAAAVGKKSFFPFCEAWLNEGVRTGVVKSQPYVSDAQTEVQNKADIITSCSVGQTIGVHGFKGNNRSPVTQIWAPFPGRQHKNTVRAESRGGVLKGIYLERIKSPSINPRGRGETGLLQN